MHPLTHTATHPEPLAIAGSSEMLGAATSPEMLGGLLLMIGFGAYHGLNPGMGWLFALALGLQQKNIRAVWRSLLPISLGHALSIALVAGAILLAGELISTAALRFITAGLLLGFGVIKLLTYYRHPRWVGMRVSMRDLLLWSFLMAMAHGAGLMVAPTLLGIATPAAHHGAPLAGGAMVAAAVVIHTAAMLAVMATVAGIVYYKAGLAILRRGWINFDLIWAVALLVVGASAMYHAFGVHG
jgi:hypothetical protein